MSCSLSLMTPNTRFSTQSISDFFTQRQSADTDPTALPLPVKNAIKIPSPLMLPPSDQRPGTARGIQPSFSSLKESSDLSSPLNTALSSAVKPSASVAAFTYFKPAQSRPSTAGSMMSISSMQSVAEELDEIDSPSSMTQSEKRLPPPAPSTPTTRGRRASLLTIPASPTSAETDLNSFSSKSNKTIIPSPGLNSPDGSASGFQLAQSMQLRRSQQFDLDSRPMRRRRALTGNRSEDEDRYNHRRHIAQHEGGLGLSAEMLDDVNDSFNTWATVTHSERLNRNEENYPPGFLDLEDDDDEGQEEDNAVPQSRKLLKYLSTSREVQLALGAVGIYPSPAELSDILSTNNRIDRVSFSRLVARLYIKRQSESRRNEEFMDVFKALDEGGKGWVDEDTLRGGLAALWPEMDPEDLEQIIASAPREGVSGYIYSQIKLGRSPHRKRRRPL